MDPATEFRRHADECRRMARATVNLADRATWNQMAERWTRCAALAESERNAVAGARPSRRRMGRVAGRPQHAA
jgi:hypothetical protein